MRLISLSLPTLPQHRRRAYMKHGKEGILRFSYGFHKHIHAHTHTQHTHAHTSSPPDNDDDDDKNNNNKQTKNKKQKKISNRNRDRNKIKTKLFSKQNDMTIQNTHTNHADVRTDGGSMDIGPAHACSQIDKACICIQLTLQGKGGRKIKLSCWQDI